MATKKQKRLAGEAKAREREAAEKQRQEAALRAVQQKRKQRRDARLRAEHAGDNAKIIHKVHNANQSGQTMLWEHEDVAES